MDNERLRRCGLACCIRRSNCPSTVFARRAESQSRIDEAVRHHPDIERLHANTKTEPAGRSTRSQRQPAARHWHRAQRHVGRSANSARSDTVRLLPQHVERFTASAAATGSSTYGISSSTSPRTLRGSGSASDWLATSLPAIIRRHLTRGTPVHPSGMNRDAQPRRLPIDPQGPHTNTSRRPRWLPHRGAANATGPT